ncbi:hypothetical protein BU17DRAFT_50874 [Hysterangium stoloniferum]|nr:hypothetical protein BU17DRAFT_50874 [Hysterangium stoloniferum]
MFGFAIPPLKLFLLVGAFTAQYVAVKPPHPPPSTGDKIIKGPIFERSPRIMDHTKLVTFVLCRRSPTLTTLSTISTSFITGICIMFLAVIVRIMCYTALGAFFTFEITIRPGHKLIKSGPYSYVRHPGYTASISMVIGTMFTCLGSNSYIAACGVVSTPFRSVVYAWFVFMIYVILSLFRRGKIEDEELRALFKEEWEAYRRAVPYKFIPYIV